MSHSFLNALTELIPVARRAMWCRKCMAACSECSRRGSWQYEEQIQYHRYPGCHLRAAGQVTTGRAVWAVTSALGVGKLHFQLLWGLQVSAHPACFYNSWRAAGCWSLLWMGSYNWSIILCVVSLYPSVSWACACTMSTMWITKLTSSACKSKRRRIFWDWYLGCLCVTVTGGTR